MDDKTAVIIMVAIAVVTFLIADGCRQVELTNREAIKAGLQQKTDPGSQGWHWTK